MASTLTVDKMTHNGISVTWNVSIREITGKSSTCCRNCGSRKNDPITSPPFSFLTDGTLILFSLNINYPSGSGLKVIVKHNLNKEARAIVTLSLDNPLATVILRTHLTESWLEDCEFDYPNLSLQTIVNAANSPTHYPDIFSIIRCEITWLGISDSSPRPRTPHFPKELCLPSIPYDNEVKPDVKLILEEKELSAHKNVLALHSPVFLGMFDAPMKESKENRVVIEDVAFDTMGTLLTIIYSGETETLDDIQVALDVLAVTEKYQMLAVKKVCEYKLQLKVDKANVLELLDEADKYNAFGLLKLCIEYIIVERLLITDEELKIMCLARPNLATTLISTQIGKLRSIPCNEVRSLS